MVFLVMVKIAGFFKGLVIILSVLRIQKILLICFQKEISKQEI